MKPSKKILVIGNGMVSLRFCEKLVEYGGLQEYSVTILGEEFRPAYDRVHLSEFFAGKSADDLVLSPASWYKENGIELKLGVRAESFDKDKKIVLANSGEKFSYDILVFATGSNPFVPNVEGIEKDGIYFYRTIEDLEAMTEYGKQAKTAAVIGGGLLGLEAAKAMLDLGLKTHVIEYSERLMPRQIDNKGSQILTSKIEKLGVTVHLKKDTVRFMGNQKVTGMFFKDNTVLDVDMVVISAGIKPRDEVARFGGIKVGERGGIIVDDALETSEKGIYAIGEVALHKGMIYGLVAPGYDMADVLAANLCGKSKKFESADMSTKLKLIGVDVASFGDAFSESAKTLPIEFTNHLKGIYKKFILSEDGKYLLGGILVGDADQYGQLLQIMQNKIVLPKDPDGLFVGGPTDGEGFKTDLPDTAKICSCNNVSKGDIVSCIKDNETFDINGIKSCTKAGAGCGGCIPMVTDILKAQMKVMGRVVTNHLCEHFPHSRQELYHIVKIKKLKNFNDVIRDAGNGTGCEICKPAVASILASLWNDNIQDHATIQDTNDRYLANIQRGGTYSVIPRIPGGEITPEKLIAIGLVAQKYSLYCKITGGQRIDLLGAKVDELPMIWKDLIDAGFESGHAYGKALRTVKSCVGSTWCRFGVQDSTGFAIRVEERYRGLRAPHKLKSAVSGCTRECAEAQSKDFGIIATEHGWNLYVCGNGGITPQHALLLASDLDDATCIKYIDRFLMYYIQTADRLHRTSTWLNKLEGGIEHLKDVIINDSLGICEELEKQMQYQVDTYKCEWKEVVETPALQKRFHHFVNSNKTDETLQFVSERGQKRPADWPNEKVKVGA
jgi:nitrite reductase (NADH) large subunit